jgi:hypothetical protein
MNLNCQYCSKQFDSDPILIPCGWAICSNHIKRNEFENCMYCGEVHLDNVKYSIIKQIQVQLEQKRQRERIVKIIEKLESLKPIKNDPYSHIYNSFDIIINQIDLRKEEFIESAKNYFDNNVNKLKEIRNNLKLNEENLAMWRNIDLDLIKDDAQMLISPCNGNLLGKIIQ